MKRRFTACIIMLAILSSLFTAASAAAYSTGDVDGNGQVLADDARLALRASAKLENLSKQAKAAADVDGDGQVLADDARTILRVSAKLERFREDSPVPYYEPAVFISSSASAVLDLGYIDLGDNYKLTMSSVQETEYSEQMDAWYKTYDVNLNDTHELDGVAELRVPYSADHVEAGQDPAKCVAAMYLDPETGGWEPVLYDVDAANREIVIYTDHFSTFGCFTFRNESSRMAKALSVSDVGAADTAAAVAAMNEYMDNGGEAGEKCRDLARPYAETFLDQLKGRANAAADKMTNWSNIANLLMATTPGLESGVNGYKTTRLLWKDFGYAGIACAAMSLVIQMANDGKTPADVANMYKDAMYLLISVSQDSLLGTIGSAVWVVDRALTEMNTYGWNKVKDDLKACYRWYMEKENRWHGKPRTMP
nr:dockerin type I repeat-containing protein [Clostridia bacterium]